jgi:hypothetical protein
MSIEYRPLNPHGIEENKIRSKLKIWIDLVFNLLTF